MRLWRRHPIISIGLAIALAFALAIAIYSEPPWTPGKPTTEFATIWVTTLTAVGTILAAIAAVWNADEAARNADLAARIARETAEREERTHHDAVRPVLSVRMRWATVRYENRNIEGELLTPEWQSFFDQHGDNGSVTLLVKNDGSHTAVYLHALLERLDGDTRQPHYLTLRTSETARFRLNLPVGESIEIGRSAPEIANDTRWYLTFLYEDILGSLWQTRGLIEISDMGGRIPDSHKGVRILRGLLFQDVPLESATQLTELPPLPE